LNFQVAVTGHDWAAQNIRAMYEAFRDFGKGSGLNF